MDRMLGLVLAACLAAGTTTAVAQSFVETGREFRQSDRVTMGGDLITADEQRAFDERRKAARNNSAELDRVEADERALLNQRVAERIAAALNPANLQSPAR